MGRGRVWLSEEPAAAPGEGGSVVGVAVLVVAEWVVGVGAVREKRGWESLRAGGGRGKNRGEVVAVPVLVAVVVVGVVVVGEGGGEEGEEGEGEEEGGGEVKRGGGGEVEGEGCNRSTQPELLPSK